MKLYKRIIRKALITTNKKDKPRKVYFGTLKGIKWIYNSGYSDYWMGIYELEIAKKFVDKVKSSSIVYDLGAHIGYYTLLASKYLKEAGKVYAFEPLPLNFEKLSIHVKSNNLRNVFVFNNAVAKNNGKVTFSNSPNDSANTYIENSYMFENFDHIQVNAVTLDSFVKTMNNPPPDLIKMDVEGAEFDVLKGAESILNEYHPTIFLSTHNCQNKGVHKKCIEYLTSLGYSFDYFNFHEKKTEYDDPWYEFIAEFKMV